ncbi:sugar transferase [Pseudobutyrivibrio sp.]
MYAKFFKRLIDFILALVGIVVLSPLLLILIILGAMFMGGNPFFTQERPGLHERVFKLVKFRSMDNRRDANGELLPDEVRLNKYGRFLRASSLDELPELFNILVGDMALIGPRPLLVRYLDRYNEEQHHRHDVRPGLTGYAQAHGRNAVSWEDKFAMDVWYARNISFALDCQIIVDTVKAVLKRDGISSETSATMEEFMGTPEGVVSEWSLLRLGHTVPIFNMIYVDKQRQLLNESEIVRKSTWIFWAYGILFSIYFACLLLGNIVGIIVGIFTLLIGLYIACKIDLHINREAYEVGRKHRISAVEKTIQEFLGKENLTFEENLAFIEWYDINFEKLLPKKIVDTISEVYLIVVSFIIYMVSTLIDASNSIDVKHGLIVLILLFVLQKMADSSYLNNIIKYKNSCHRAVIGDYKEYLIEKKLNINRDV